MAIWLILVSLNPRIVIFFWGQLCHQKIFIKESLETEGPLKLVLRSFSKHLWNVKDSSCLVHQALVFLRALWKSKYVRIRVSNSVSIAQSLKWKRSWRIISSSENPVTSLFRLTFSLHQLLVSWFAFLAFLSHNVGFIEVICFYALRLLQTLMEINSVLLHSQFRYAIMIWLIENVAF